MLKTIKIDWYRKTRKHKACLCALAFLATCAGILRAEDLGTVGIAPTIAYVYESEAKETKFQGGQLYLLVADIDRDGFGVDNMGKIGEQFELGEDDRVIKAWESPSTPPFALGQCKPNALGLSVEGNEAGVFSPGTPFAVYFFSDVNLSDYTEGTLATGTSYGFFTKSTFEVPSPGGDFTGEVIAELFPDQQVGGGGGTNDAPVLEAIGDQSVDEGGKLAFTINASDADDDDMTLSVTGLPDGEFFSADPKASPATWSFSWTPQEDESGVYESVEFTVSDGSLSDSETISITVDEVNSAPVLESIGDKTVTAGETLTFDISATDADVPANILAFSATNVPDGADFDGTTFTWTPSDEQAGSNFNITFTVTDDGDPQKEDSETITVTVNERVNHAPIAEAPQGMIVEAGGTLTIPLVAADEDGDEVQLSIVDAPANGSLGTIDQETQTVQYTADATFAGEDHFSFQASDGELNSDVVKVFVLVRSEEGWMVNLNLDGADFATLTIGADPEATDGHEDSFDELVPPAATSSRSVEGNFAGLYRPPFAEPQQYFRRDIRALDGDYRWILELEVQDGNDPLTVSWDAETLPDDIALALSECDADGTPLEQNDVGTLMANQTEITVTDQDGVVRYCIQPFEGEIEFALSLNGGAWNLISLPLTPNNPAVEDVFSDTNLTVGGEQRTLRDSRRGALHSGAVWDWDEAAQQYVAAEQIEAYQGYWVYIPEGQGGTLNITGIPAAPPTTLHKHWNLVGGDSEPTSADNTRGLTIYQVGGDSEMTNTNIAWASIWKWVNGQYAKATTLERGLGYWIYSFVDDASLQQSSR